MCHLEEKNVNSGPSDQVDFSILPNGTAGSADVFEALSLLLVVAVDACSEKWLVHAISSELAVAADACSCFLFFACTSFELSPDHRRLFRFCRFHRVSLYGMYMYVFSFILFSILMSY